jgi:hypothetical protein
VSVIGRAAGARSGQYALAMRRRQLTHDESAERENDPSELTRYFFRHPWTAGVASGVLLLVLGLARGIPWPIASGVDVAVVLFAGLVWRPG